MVKSQLMPPPNGPQDREKGLPFPYNIGVPLARRAREAVGLSADTVMAMEMILGKIARILEDRGVQAAISRKGKAERNGRILGHARNDLRRWQARLANLLDRYVRTPNGSNEIGSPIALLPDGTLVEFGFARAADHVRVRLELGPDGASELDRESQPTVIERRIPLPEILWQDLAKKPFPFFRIPMSAQEGDQTSFFRTFGDDVKRARDLQDAISERLADWGQWNDLDIWLTKLSNRRVDIEGGTSHLPLHVERVKDAIEAIGRDVSPKIRESVVRSLFAQYYDDLYPVYFDSWKEEVTQSREELFRYYNKIVVGIMSIPVPTPPPHLVAILRAIRSNVININKLLSGILPLKNYDQLSALVSQPAPVITKEG